MNLLRRLAHAAVCALMFTLPWEDSFSVPGLGAISRAVGLVAFLLAVGALLTDGHARKLPPFQFFTAAFVCWAAGSLLWAIDPAFGLSRAVTLTQLCGYSWLIWEYADNERHQKQLLQWFLAGCAISVIGGVAALITGQGGLDARYAAAGFDPNELATTLAISLPLAWSVATAPTSTRAWRAYAGTLLPAATFAIVLTASRGAAIAAAAALFVIPLTLRLDRARTRILLIALLAAGAFLILHYAPVTSWSRLASTREQFMTGNLNHRGAIWRTGFEVFLGHPFLGVGIGGFGAAVAGTLGTPSVAHNSFLSVAVEEGLVGLGLFLAVFVTVGRAIWALPRRERTILGVVMLALVLGMSSLTWEHRKVPWTMLALAAAIAAPARERRHVAAWGGPAPARGVAYLARVDVAAPRSPPAVQRDLRR